MNITHREHITTNIIEINQDDINVVFKVFYNLKIYHKKKHIDTIDDFVYVNLFKVTDQIGKIIKKFLLEEVSKCFDTLENEYIHKHNLDKCDVTFNYTITTEQNKFTLSR